MRGVVYRGPGTVELVGDLPMPELEGPRDAIVRVTATALCGTDLHPYRGEIPGFTPGTVLGHEFSGVVVEAGPEVPFAAGERVTASDIVACGRCARCAAGWHYQCPEATLFGYDTVVGRAVPGGQAEYVRVPYADVVLSRCPDDLTDEQMLFAGDGLATGYAAAAAVGVEPGDAVGVVGAGPVGLLSAMCASAFGADVVVTDVDPARRAHAAALGLACVEPDGLADALTGSPGGSVIDAVGTREAMALAVAAAGGRATVAVVGVPGAGATPFDARSAFGRELTLRFVVGDPIRDRDRVVALMRLGRVDPSAVVTHRLPLTDAVRAYELFHTRGALKVVLTTGT